MTGSIEQTLKDREKTHGDFLSKARLIQKLKELLRGSPNWDHMASDMQEALDNIMTKIGRICYGNPFHTDNWHDIIGYAKLVEDPLLPASLDQQIQIVWGQPAEVIDDE